MIDATEPDHNQRVGGLRPGPTERGVLVVRLAIAIVFIVFGLGKFVNHGSEVASFRHYGLPLPGAFAYAIGVLEIAGGLSLAAGFGVRIVALVLAIDMVGAILVSGIAHGEIVSLTLAPVLLVAMICLLGRDQRDRRSLAGAPSRRDRRVTP